MSPGWCKSVAHGARSVGGAGIRKGQNLSGGRAACRTTVRLPQTRPTKRELTRRDMRWANQGLSEGDFGSKWKESRSTFVIIR